MQLFFFYFQTIKAFGDFAVYMACFMLILSDTDRNNKERHNEAHYA